MKNNQKSTNGILFLAGAIAGGAVVYFLQSPRGQKMKELLLQRADDLSTEIKNKAMNAASTVSATADSVLSNTNAAISKVQSQIVGTTNEMAEAGADTVDDFKQGVKKAEAHIEERIKNA